MLVAHNLKMGRKDFTLHLKALDTSVPLQPKTFRVAAFPFSQVTNQGSAGQVTM
jgi:hypothetical protein